jgi:hypothetical protein
MIEANERGNERYAAFGLRVKQIFAAKGKILLSKAAATNAKLKAAIAAKAAKAKVAATASTSKLKAALTANARYTGTLRHPAATEPHTCHLALVRTRAVTSLGPAWSQHTPRTSARRFGRSSPSGASRLRTGSRSRTLRATSRTPRTRRRSRKTAIRRVRGRASSIHWPLGCCSTIPTRGWTTLSAGTFCYAVVFQGIASLALPMFIIHQTVHAAQYVTKRAGRFTKWGPTVAGLALIPALPYAVDEPAEHVIDTAFDTLWPDENSKAHSKHSSES